MIHPLKINKKVDNDAKVAQIIKENIPTAEYMSADEVNAMVAKINEMVPAINVSNGGFQGTLSINEKRVDSGFYIPQDDGKYINAGDVVVDRSKGIHFVTFDGDKWDVAVVPIVADGKVEEGNKGFVSGGEVFRDQQKVTGLIGFKQISIGNNFIQELSDSDLSDKEFWRPGYYRENGAPDSSKTFFMSNKKYELPANTKCKGRFNHYGNACIVLFDKDNKVVQFFKKENALQGYTNIEFATPNYTTFLGVSFHSGYGELSRINCINLDVVDVLTEDKFLFSNNEQFLKNSEFVNEHYVTNEATKVVDIYDLETISGFKKIGKKLNFPLKTKGKFRIKFDIKFNSELQTLDKRTTFFAKINNWNFGAVPFDRTQARGRSQVITQSGLFGIWNGNAKVVDFDIDQYSEPFWGDFTFGIRYNIAINSDNKNIYVSNINNKFIIVNEDTQEQLYSFEYESNTPLKSLFESLRGVSFLDTHIKSVQSKKCTDILEFEKIYLSGEYIYNKAGEKTDGCGFLFMSLKVSEKWHTIEMLVDDKTCVFAVNGRTHRLYTHKTISFSQDAVVTLGSDDIDFEIKDTHITINSWGEAEHLSYKSALRPNLETSTYYYKLISNYSPQLIIWEGHNLENKLDGDKLEDSMSTTTDRLGLVIETMQNKGYEPICMEDLLEWKLKGKQLPKRCYLFIFDDYRWGNYLHSNTRQIFNRHNINPALCVNTYRINEKIVVNGVEMNGKDVWNGQRAEGWYPHSHTKDHRYMYYDDPALMIGKLEEDALSCISAGVNSDVITYPFGAINQNNLSALRFSSFKIGVFIVSGRFPDKFSHNYYIPRIEIGDRSPIEDVLKNIY